MVLSQASTQSAQSGNPWWVDLWRQYSILFLIMGLLVFMWVSSARGRNAERRKRQNMLDSLKKGDRIQTIGGILGSVVEVRQTDVTVKVDESSNTKMRFVRSAIDRVVEEEKKS